MVGIQALRRDVLQWLVSLNLSFPLKNIKRDFSNGFLVGEIISRYYPQEVQMHSFDNGTKFSKKKDNWEQLKKIFWKLDFPIFADEIERIINCDHQEGACPLLERLYGFLTRKRYKPEDSNSEDAWLGANDYSSGNLLVVDGQANLDTEDYAFLSLRDNDNDSDNYNDDDNDNDDDESCMHNATNDNDFSSPNMKSKMGIYMEKTNADDQRLSKACLSKSNADPMVVSQIALIPFKSSNENFNSLDEREILISPQKKLSNAVEKARLRERSRSTGKAASLNVELTSDYNSRDKLLAFRSPNRQRDFRMYTVTDYKRQLTGCYVKLGTLGPDTTESVLKQREKIERMKEFGRHARSINVTQVPDLKKPKEKPPSCRRKALEFASKIPKPKLKLVLKENLQQHIVKHSEVGMTELEKMEAKHQLDRERIEAMRRDLETFIR